MWKRSPGWMLFRLCNAVSIKWFLTEVSEWPRSSAGTAHTVSMCAFGSLRGYLPFTILILRLPFSSTCSSKFIKRTGMWSVIRTSGVVLKVSKKSCISRTVECVNTTSGSDGKVLRKLAYFDISDFSGNWTGLSFWFRSISVATVSLLFNPCVTCDLWSPNSSGVCAYQCFDRVFRYVFFCSWAGNSKQWNSICYGFYCPYEIVQSMG